MSKLKRELEKFDRTLKKEYVEIPGEMGAYIKGKKTVEVPDRVGYVYVKLRTNLSEIIQAFNDRVSPSYGLAVIVRREGNKYIVDRRDVGRYENWEDKNKYVPRHGDTHSFDLDGSNIGADPVWVYPYQFMPSLVSPFGVKGAENVFIYPYSFVHNGTWHYSGNTGTSNLTNYRPASGSSVVLITLDTVSGNPYLFASTGTYIPSSVTGTAGFIPYLPSIDETQYIPLSFVTLSSGTFGIGWNNIHDVRQLAGGGGITSIGVIPHNDLDGLQGGDGNGSFYHLESGSFSNASSGGDGGLRFGVGGKLALITNVDSPLVIAGDVTINNWRSYLVETGSTGTSTFDINKNGTTVFTNQANRPSINYNNVSKQSISGQADIISFTGGDIISLDIDSVATGAGSLSVVGSVLKNITITATSGLFKYVGSVDPIFTYTSSLPTFPHTGQLSRTPGETGGSYPITIGSLSLPYYLVNFVPANFGIADTLTPTATTVIDTWSGAAANLIDANDSTLWESSTWRNASPWCKIDLGSSKTIVQLRLLQDATSWSATQFRVETSPDNSSWTTNFTSATISTAEHFVTLSSVACRYIRVTCSAGGSGSGWKVYDVSVKGW